MQPIEGLAHSSRTAGMDGIAAERRGTGVPNQIGSFGERFVSKAKTTQGECCDKRQRGCPGVLLALRDDSRQDAEQSF